MSSPSPEELTNAIEELRQKVDVLSAPLEDALAHRVFQKSLEQFKKWISGWLAVVAAGLLFFGYKGYDEVISAGQKEASEYIKKQAVVQLQKDIQSEFEQVRVQVREKLKQSALEDASNLDADLAKLLSETQLAVDERLRNFATQLAPVVKDPQLPTKITEKQAVKLAGFAFYGIESGDNEWSERYFKRISGDPAGVPKPGDIVVAIAPVNAREGVIEFIDARGWVNKKVIGLINPETQLTVRAVVPVAGSFIWIKFDQ